MKGNLMKTVRMGFVFLIVIAAIGCAHAQSSAPTATSTATLPVTSTPALPTLPPTLTPLPPTLQATPNPSSMAYQPVSLSAADDQVYQQALKDIPVYRQGKLHIVVQDSQGNPLPGYRVTYQQTAHDFIFGGNADPWQIMKLGQVGMNTMTVYLDWGWQESFPRDMELDFLDYWMGVDELASGGVRIKTNSVFGMGDDLSSEFRNIPFDELLVRVNDYMFTTVSKFSDSVDVWEAILEPNFGNHNTLNLSRDQYYQTISASIRGIRDADPNALVEINLSYPCGGIDWLDNFQIVQEMLDRSIDFDVLGLQMYYNTLTGEAGTPDQFTRMSLAEMSACFDRYQTMLAPYGKKIDGSEFSVPSEAPAGWVGYWNIPWSQDTQAQYLTTAYTIFFSKLSNMALVWWNSVDPGAFVPNGGLIDAAGQPKKAYYALEQLVNSWTTSGEGTTGTDGSLDIRGFGGEYSFQINDPQTGASMDGQFHIHEQQSGNLILTFTSDNQLIAMKTNLEKLVSYWEAQGDPIRTQKGKDYLALAEHHLQLQERGLAEQSFQAGLNELAIEKVLNIALSGLSLSTLGSTDLNLEGGSALIWGATTLHYNYPFPPGQVTIKVEAHSHSVAGEWPIMVIGIGAHYTEPLQITNTQTATYTFTTPTTGNEQEITIRFPYYGDINQRIVEAGGDVGELKLYIDSVHLTIRTTEVP
jgi:hypothetical protein